MRCCELARGLVTVPVLVALVAPVRGDDRARRRARRLSRPACPDFRRSQAHTCLIVGVCAGQRGDGPCRSCFGVGARWPACRSTQAGVPWWCVGVYLRESRRTNRDGSVVAYLQLAHNERHPVSGSPVAKVVHSFGRADKVDREALARLVSSISRFLTPDVAAAAAAGADATSWPPSTCPNHPGSTTSPQPPTSEHTATTGAVVTRPSTASPTYAQVSQRIHPTVCPPSAELGSGIVT